MPHPCGAAAWERPDSKSERKLGRRLLKVGQALPPANARLRAYCIRAPARTTRHSKPRLLRPRDDLALQGRQVAEVVAVPRHPHDACPARAALPARVSAVRSEERRVGTEC